jgi:hypothetical protein
MGLLVIRFSFDEIKRLNEASNAETIFESMHWS